MYLPNSERVGQLTNIQSLLSQNGDGDRQVVQQISNRQTMNINIMDCLCLSMLLKLIQFIVGPGYLLSFCLAYSHDIHSDSMRQYL